MRYVEFDPEKHKDAFVQRKLYEWQDIFPEKEGDPIVGRWVKVTTQEVYEDALNNPMFFAVEVEG
ncbi:MAG: hypothetical protein H8D67_17515 [Deltaproteobacteria bacterium]|nr:hypothetical protein [Deltaproteobacteria bacterium]